MVNLTVYPNGDNIEGALKRFKKLMMVSGLTREIRQLDRYEKPSDKLRRKRKESRKKALRGAKKRAEIEAKYERDGRDV